MTKSHPHFRIVSARGNQFRGHIVAANGKLVWRTEAYTTRAKVIKAIRVASDALIPASEAGGYLRVTDTTKAAKKK